ncbi:MAG: hypothetical protein H6Q90_1108 [Deltaproteobacteria bacterium]|nr:hypothetical protein [Deltaproteobacteria bacterium]
MGIHWSGSHAVAKRWGAAGVPLALALALLTGCPTVDLGDTPTDINLCNPPGGIEYFQNEVWPNYIRPADTANGCTKNGGCHNEAGGNALNFKTNPVDFAFNFRQAQVFLNCGTAEMSPLLSKPLAGVDTHGGGDIYATTNDPAVVIFLGWF